MLLWYQTTETLPGSPAIAHGHSTRALGGAAIAVGCDHVWPQSFETVIMIWLASGVGPLPQPPVPFALRGSVSQVR